MEIPEFTFPAVDQFIGREETLRTLEEWWEDPNADPLNLYGRRRVGKSWLFRKLAQGKTAIILVADKTTKSQQMDNLAKQIETYVGYKPAITDLAALIRFLYRLAATEKVLVVLDEFPDLLGFTKKEIFSSLSSVQAVMEAERDASQIKLILCGSAMSQMAAMQDSTNPLHGRLRPFELSPMTFSEARGFFDQTDPIDQLNRYSISGGMPKYLAQIGRGDLPKLIAERVVSPNAPLYSEVESILLAELREPATYFAILAELAVRPKDVGEIAKAIGKGSNELGAYLNNLVALRLVQRKSPVGADSTVRANQYECVDGFVRFWFRFVRPYKADLETGADARAHVDNHVMTELAHHASVEFERVFRRWAIQTYPTTANIGSWWGRSIPGHEHPEEEIDLVGIKGKKALLIGEAKWTNDALKASVFNRLVSDKIPALKQSGLNVVPERLLILASRSGFTQEVKDIAAGDPNIRLVEARDILSRVV